MHDTGDDHDMNGRIRSIKPELLEDALAANLSDTAWRLWVSSWLLSDDYGRFRAEDRYLAARVWQDTERAHVVPGAIAELALRGFIVVYAVRGQLYAANLGWERHQRIDNAAKTRLLPGPEDQEAVLVTKDQLLTGNLAEARGDSPRFAARATRAASGMEGKGKEGIGQEGSGVNPNPPTAAPPVLTNPAQDSPKAKKTRARAGLSFLPTDWQPRDVEADQVRKAGLELESVVGDFRDYWLGQGKQMADWNAVFRQNLRKVLSTDWLMQRHRAKPKPAIPAKQKQQETHGPAVPAPPAVRRALAAFVGGDPGPSDLPPLAGGPTPEPSTPKREGVSGAVSGDE